MKIEVFWFCRLLSNVSPAFVQSQQTAGALFNCTRKKVRTLSRNPASSCSLAGLSETATDIRAPGACRYRTKAGGGGGCFVGVIKVRLLCFYGTLARDQRSKKEGRFIGRLRMVHWANPITITFFKDREHKHGASSNVIIHSHRRPSAAVVGAAISAVASVRPLSPCNAAASMPSTGATVVKSQRR
jgi:hypothetical protein